jgi:hypothetical protein
MKKILLFVGLSALYALASGQNSIPKSVNISDLKARIALSTAKDPALLNQKKSTNTNQLRAEELVKTTTVKFSSLKSAVLGKAGIDTSYTYPWNSTTQDWDAKPIVKMLSYYDARHLLTQYTVFAWNYDANDWMDSVQYFYTYNNRGQILNTIQQMWMFDGYESYSWVNVDNNVYEYDNAGVEIKFTYEYWDYENSVWNIIWKYDQADNNIQTLESYYDASTDAWTPYLNFEYFYNLKNQQEYNIVYIWDANSEVWTEGFQYKYCYDSNGNNTIIHLLTWNSNLGQWDNAQLETINYTTANKPGNYLFQLWDIYLGQWVDSQRGTYKYDAQGNNVCVVGEDYDAYSDTWSLDFENVYTYNAQNKKISESVLYYDAGPGNWYGGYNTKSLKKINSTSPEQTAYAQLDIYPNPTVEKLTIQNNTLIQSIEVYDLSGSKVFSAKGLNLYKYSLDVNSYKPGCYFVAINGNSNKFVKQ